MRYRTRRSGRSSNRPAFSLVETLIVLTIMSVILAIGLPRLDPNRYRADAAAVLVRSLLMQAQRDAIVRQHDLIVSIDTAKSRLILGYDKNDDGSIQLSERVRLQSLPEGDRYAPPPKYLPETGMSDYGAFRANSIRTVSGLPSVIFRRDGSVSSAIELYTASPRKKLIDWRVVTVVQATGKTQYYRYGDKAAKWVSAQQ